MKTCKVYFLLIFSLLNVFAIAKAQMISKKWDVDIMGEVKTPVNLTPLGMDKMGKTEVVDKDHDEKEHTYAGVELYALLEQAGMTLWPELMGKNLTKYLLIKASDGYHVVFSLAEVDPELSDKKIVLANRKDGKLLTAEEGPFRMIIAGEKRKPRFIRQVISIEVKYAK